MKRNLSLPEVLAVLQSGIDRAGSMRKHAVELGVSPAYLSDIMGKKREPGDKVLSRLQLEKSVVVVRTVTFTRITTNGR